MKNVHINSLNVNLDLLLAMDRVENRKYLNDNGFHRCSEIYRTSNETISHKPYIDAMKDKKKVLSITASGDQIINSIFFGAKEIKGLDISIFPKYFTALKLAALKVLSKDSYLFFIVGDKFNLPLSKVLYKKVRDELDDDVRMFWDNLFSKYTERQLRDSALFRSFTISSTRTTENNPYLQGDNYEETKKKLDNVKIELEDSDIFKVDKNSLGKFDLALLSNVVNYYMEDSPNEEKANSYKKFLRSLPLEKNGNAVTYNFAFNGNLGRYFKDKEFKVHLVKENVSIACVENEIIVYTKKKMFPFV